MVEITSTGTIRLSQGNTLPLSYVWPDYNPLYKVYLTIKRDDSVADLDADYLEEGTVVGSVVSWDVPPAVTELLTGNYYYEIQISNGTTVVRTPVFGTLIITRRLKHGR